jgi:hypothetical protein
MSCPEGLVLQIRTLDPASFWDAAGQRLGAEANTSGTVQGGSHNYREVVIEPLSHQNDGQYSR